MVCFVLKTKRDKEDTMAKKMEVGFIGGGNMAEALIRGILQGKTLSASQCRVCDVLQDRLTYLKKAYGVQTASTPGPVVEPSRVVILAVKPQQIPTALKAIIPLWSQEKLLVSIAAGITLDQLAQSFPSPPRLVRVMPNTPALVQAGISALCQNDTAREDDFLLAESLFKAVGETVRLDESLFDAVTGLSGSGPAYVFVILEALSDAGVKMGLPRAVASKLALETVYGASRLARESDRTFGQLKDMVTSPGGTTIAGLHEMEKAGLRGILMNAVEAATRRSRELREPHS
jgi:pyrroline-5-carboxylate reductase